MGCDIHCYIEYNRKWDGKDHWSGFGGRINPGRHYGIFAKLVGVRNYPQYGIIPLSEPKGLPKEVAWETLHDYTLWVTETQDDVSGHASREYADIWVKSGSSTWIDDKRITHPDWHSTSWITREELQKVFDDPKTQFDPKEDHEWVALLDCLKSFENQGLETRVVFWFDN